MSEGGQLTTPHKYSYEETLNWANKEPELKENGTTFLYVFGGIAFLFIFAAILLFSTNGRNKTQTKEILPTEDGDKIEEIRSETDATTSEVSVEFDLLEDDKTKNEKSSKKTRKSL